MVTRINYEAKKMEGKDRRGVFDVTWTESQRNYGLPDQTISEHHTLEEVQEAINRLEKQETERKIIINHWKAKESAILTVLGQ